VHELNALFAKKREEPPECADVSKIARFEVDHRHPRLAQPLLDRIPADRLETADPQLGFSIDRARERQHE
jgi:hypothetical protein